MPAGTSSSILPIFFLTGTGRVEKDRLPLYIAIPMVWKASFSSTARVRAGFARTSQAASTATVCAGTM
ncbi:Uncharacterised protein [Segatella copri]|nr:Uncharacterised protein [Segatella copri]